MAYSHSTRSPPMVKRTRSISCFWGLMLDITRPYIDVLFFGTSWKGIKSVELVPLISLMSYARRPSSFEKACIQTKGYLPCHLPTKKWWYSHYAPVIGWVTTLSWYNSKLRDEFILRDGQGDHVILGDGQGITNLLLFVWGTHTSGEIVMISIDCVLIQENLIALV